MIPCIVCLILLVSVGVFSYFAGMYYFSDDNFVISVNPHEVVFETDKKFLSVALDISFMRCLFHNMSEKDWTALEELSSLLSPAYLRLGGTDADRTFFSFNSNGTPFSKDSECEDDSIRNITITGKDWLKINKFAQKSKLNLIIDLNVLLRKGSEWDSSNARPLLDFSEENDLHLDFQLGNEPNSFPHVFNTAVSGSQLAKDFRRLKNLLESRKLYRKSKLIGPDVTRPKNVMGPSLEYLKAFLSEKPPVDVVSWHQYYLNGRDATLEDFLNPETFEVLSPQIESVSNVVREHFKSIPIWISETSSAYGNGAPMLSNRFAASFLWVDKLGTAAKLGMSVVVRQSLFKGNYALITERLTPTPDFWISVFYKNIVGRKVLGVTTKASEDRTKYSRFYSHCVLSPDPAVNASIVVYGMNLSNRTELIIISGMALSYPIRAYIFKPELNNLKSKTVLLNGTPLLKNTTFSDMLKLGVDVQLPIVLTPETIAFWLVEDKEKNVCGT